MKRLMVTAVVAAGLLLALFSAVALAGPSHPPNYGNYNPLNLSNEPPESWGVEKIKPPLADYGESDSIHIITDPLAVPGSPADVKGWVTFWCQSTVGFQYQIGVKGLEPSSTYTVRSVGALSLNFGSFRTDRRGNGGVHGVKQLPPGGYYIVVQIRDAEGHLVLDSSADGQGFLVY